MSASSRPALGQVDKSSDLTGDGSVVSCRCWREGLCQVSLPGAATQDVALPQFYPVSEAIATPIAY